MKDALNILPPRELSARMTAAEKHIMERDKRKQAKAEAEERRDDCDGCAAAAAVIICCVVSCAFAAGVVFGLWALGG